MDRRVGWNRSADRFGNRTCHSRWFPERSQDGPLVVTVYRLIWFQSSETTPEVAGALIQYSDQARWTVLPTHTMQAVGHRSAKRKNDPPKC